MAKTPEGKTKDLIKKWEKFHSDKVKLWMIIPSAFGASTGISDYIGLVKGKGFIAIEAKADGKKNNTSKLQDLFLKTIKDYGGISAVVSNQDDLDELDRELWNEN